MSVEALSEQANQALYELCYATYTNGIGTLNREQAVIARQMWLKGYEAAAGAEIEQAREDRMRNALEILADIGNAEAFGRADLARFVRATAREGLA